MPLSRRRMLLLMGATSLASGWVPFPGKGGLLAATPAAPLFVILDDLGAGTPVAMLDRLFGAFAARGIPLGIIVRPADLAPEGSGSADSGAADGGSASVAAGLGAFLTASPGLCEVIVWQQDLLAERPYLALRRAGEARRRIEALLGPGGDRPAFPIVSVAGADPGGEPALDGLRAAGFRGVVLVPPADRPGTSGRCGVNMPCLRGGLRHGIADSAGTVAAGLGRMLRNSGPGAPLTLLLSLKALGSLPPDVVQDRAQALARAVATLIDGGRVAPALPRQHPLWFDTGTERLIGLAVAEPPAGDAAAQGAFAALRAGLAAAGHPFSLVTGDGALAPGQPADGVALSIARDAYAGAWMDEDGILHLPGATASVLTGTMSGAADRDDPGGAGGDIDGAPRDIVLTLAPADYATAAARDAVLSGLAATTANRAARLLAVPDLARGLMPDDPVYRLMLATRRDTASGAEGGAASGLADGAAEDATGPGPAERAALIEDARLAWSYVERFGDPATGLCPATVFVGTDWSTVNRSLTMWDYGSLIHGVIAAHALGLIDDAQFTERATALVRQLPAETIAGLTLPPSEIATDTGRSLTRDYNACDAGRLLAALHALDHHPLMTGRVRGAVARWNLGATVRDGRLNSVRAGRFRPFFISHCTHYAARAFGLWGIAAASPYPAAEPGESLTDARMRLLYAVAGIGAYGAEPLLHEAVEMGMSEPSAYLAEVLFTAQMRHFAATGELISVSEGPLDQAPWFSYQGLRVDVDTDRWTVQTIVPDPTPGSGAQRDAARRVISCKAAFLWAALRPGGYSARLLDLVRAQGRLPGIGFSSGIRAATGTAMAGYSDLNTNAVILQAIAYRLRHSGLAPKARPGR